MTFYISTPIYYVNGAPHIGHAYTTLVADAFARFYRQAGEEVFFQTGTDEHGLKIQREAKKQGISPQQLADKYSAQFASLFSTLQISHNRFIRTTEKIHHDVVAEVVRRMQARGDIYLARYAGWYAASDEAFYAEDEIADGKSIATGSVVEWVEEESYFFRLSKYQQPLLDYYKSNPQSILPEARRNEVVAFLESGLRDLSISRTTFQWGIPFPDDPKHVLYVWVDALTNYITGVGAFHNPTLFEKFWPCDVHLIGKDILRFHAVYWPAFLLSAGLAPPRQIFAHGWWLNEGEKMGKSKGNFLDAFQLAEEYSLDVLRYYLLREVPLGNDGNFVRARVVERNNSELADNLGNLVNRTLTMAARFLNGVCPAFEATTNPEDVAVREQAVATRERVFAHINNREPHKALEEIFGLSSHLNQYVHHSQPWSLNKLGQHQRLEQVLYHALEGIRWVSILAHAFLPQATTLVLQGLGQHDLVQATAFSTIQAFGGLQPGTPIQPPPVLFNKLELPVSNVSLHKLESPVSNQTNTQTGTQNNTQTDTKADTKTPVRKEKQMESTSSPGSQKSPESTVPAVTTPGVATLINYEQFQQVEIRVGHILAAENVKKSDKLLSLRIDVGEEQPRAVIAGIAKSFAPTELVGLRVAMITNLEPAKIFGHRSEGMLLAAETTDGKLELARYSEAVAPGTRIR